VTAARDAHQRATRQSGGGRDDKRANEDRLADKLAVRVLGWRLAPGRYIKSDRGWTPRWRFQPFTETASAFELLDQAADGYTITCKGGSFRVSVYADQCLGEASGDCLARAITLAVAQTIGLEVQP